MQFNKIENEEDIESGEQETEIIDNLKLFIDFSMDVPIKDFRHCMVYALLEKAYDLCDNWSYFDDVSHEVGCFYGEKHNEDKINRSIINLCLTGK